MKKRSESEHDDLVNSSAAQFSSVPAYPSSYIEATEQDESVERPSYHKKNHQRKVILPNERNSPKVFGKTIKNRKQPSESSGRNRISKLKEPTSSEWPGNQEKSKTSERMKDQLSIPRDFYLNTAEEPSLSQHHNKRSHTNKNVRSSNDKVGVRFSDNFKNESLKINTPRENRRIELQSQMYAANCEGIRHAFGLSADYCDCRHTGNFKRKVKVKKISRGVQCDLTRNNKCKLFCYGCFTFNQHRTRRRSERSPTKNPSRNSTGIEKNVESLEIYMPTKSKYQVRDFEINDPRLRKKSSSAAKPPNQSMKIIDNESKDTKK